MRNMLDETTQAVAQRRVQMSSMGAPLSTLNDELKGSLEELNALPAGTAMDVRLPMLEKAGWSIHSVLRTDDVNVREAEKDASKASAYVALGGIQCEDKSFELRTKMEECRATLVECMRSAVHPGKLQMSVWWLERELVAKMVTSDAFDDMFEKMQADLAQSSAADRQGADALRGELEQLKQRLGAMQQHVQTLQSGGGGGGGMGGMGGMGDGGMGLMQQQQMQQQQAAAAAAAAAGSSMFGAGGGGGGLGGVGSEDVQRLSHELSSTLANLEQLQAELSGKATSVDVSAALTAVNKQLSRIQANSMPKDQLEGVLRHKARGWRRLGVVRQTDRQTDRQRKKGWPRGRFGGGSYRRFLWALSWSGPMVP